jgi:hypothetical protein
MNETENQVRQPYNTPQFERYGNVRDLTQATFAAHLGGTDSVSRFGANTFRTH